ncbi:holin family protein [Paenibacillus sp. R14(2021)]|uniref:phage holin family protein n=1 Tax=Paenibacillus sp. R14(2021) TaxID=2859228 RepID=UPI002156FCEE|nr:phage holin family protein [Paenibacillus sp. R14(2021)]
MMNQLKDLLLNGMITAAGNGKETIWSSAAASAGVCITSWLGGWDKALQVLLVLMLSDYAIGILGAIRQKKLNSEVLYWNGIRKAVCLFVVGLASLLDDWNQPGMPLFRMTAIYFYSGREGLSVMEHLGEIGVPLPKTVRDRLEQLVGKAEGSNPNKGVKKPRDH